MGHLKRWPATATVDCPLKRDGQLCELPSRPALCRLGYGRAEIIFGELTGVNRCALLLPKPTSRRRCEVLAIEILEHQLALICARQRELDDLVNAIEHGWVEQLGLVRRE